MKTNAKVLGEVLELCSADKSSKGFPRPIVEELLLIEGYGIEGDKFAGDNLEKTVMIVGKNSYDIAKENGIELKHGSFGENILFDFDPHVLQAGDVIFIGDAQLEIREKCSICNHLSIFGPKLPKLIKDNRGIYCKILKGGSVKKGFVVHGK